MDLPVASVSGYVWLGKEHFTAAQMSRLKDALTIRPKKTSEYEDSDPDPIRLYADELERIGVPREFFRKNITRQWEVKNLTSLGGATSAGFRAGCFKGSTTGRFAEQNDAHDQIVAHLRSAPYGGGLLKAACAFGKTCVALRVAATLGRRTLVIVNKGFFMRQWRQRIQQFFPDARIGYVQQNKCQYKDKDIVIAMVHSLAARDYGDEFYKAFGMVITDECFVRTARIRTTDGLRPIDTVRVGDTVQNAVGFGNVTAVGSRLVRIEDLCLVRYSDGHDEICTKNHPFFTIDGLSAAENLAGKLILTDSCCTGIMQAHGSAHEEPQDADLRDMPETKLGSGREEVLFKEVRWGGEAEGVSGVRMVRGEPCSAGKMSVLFALLSSEVAYGTSEEECCTSFGKNEEMARGESVGSGRSVGTDAGEKPDAAGSDTDGSIGRASESGTQAGDQGRERDGDAHSTENALGCTRLHLGSGGGRIYRDAKNEPRTASESLQDRHSFSVKEDRCRGGRGISPDDSWPTSRQEERRVLEVLRVESVSGVEQEDLDRHGIRPEGDFVRVYNLSVSGHPSYVLENGAVVHNCHRIGAESWAPVIPQFNAAYRLGLTATPRRKDRADDVFWFHLGEIVYSASGKGMTPKVSLVFTHFEPRRIKRGSYVVEVENLKSAQLLNQLATDPIRNKELADIILRAIKGRRKVFVVSERLEQLWELSEMQRKSCEGLGIKATYDFVTGQRYVLDENGQRIPGKKKGEWKSRQITDEELDAAETAQVLYCTKQMVEEGFDVAPLDVLVLATPLSDPEQEIGRVQRWCLLEPGKCERMCPWRAGDCQVKPEPVIIDPVDQAVPKLVRKYESRARFYKDIGAMK